jgi:hypothetical protein
MNSLVPLYQDIIDYTRRAVVHLIMKIDFAA